MVLYVEACESGSMFKNLLSKNINGIFTLISDLSKYSSPIIIIRHLFVKSLKCTFLKCVLTIISKSMFAIRITRGSHVLLIFSHAVS